ncbi:unnamed protein product [Cunninghamella blakesleeana]
MHIIHYLSSILLLLPLLVFTLPVQDDYYNNNIETFHNNNDQQKVLMENINNQQETNVNDDDNFIIDKEKFIQMLSSHIMVEHLETAISVLSKRLASQIQNTVKLNIQQQKEKNKMMMMQNNNNGDYNMVDIKLLLNQLQGAIGSYIQDHIPSMWYAHSSSEALDSTPLKGFMEKKLNEFCSINEYQINQQKEKEDENDEYMIDYQCLKTNGHTYLLKVDDYIKEQMHYTLAEIIQQDVPALLAMVDNQVRAVIHHFNTYLLPPSSQVHLNFASLQNDPNWSNLSSLDEILDIIASVENNEKNFHSVLHYASLSRAS